MLLAPPSPRAADACAREVSLSLTRAHSTRCGPPCVVSTVRKAIQELQSLDDDAEVRADIPPPLCGRADAPRPLFPSPHWPSAAHPLGFAADF